MQQILTVAVLVFTAIPSVMAQGTAAGGIPSELRGAVWRWIGFESPAETFQVDAPERYTLAFVEGDRIALRADCNRGSASVSSPAPGALAVGPAALTRAKCPDDSLSERFARDVSRAVRFSVQAGELRLELPDGAGVLRFARER